ncbi:MAG: T9SS type A sorting domain-containing protein [Ignavibacteria bacterium]|nr:T9SS type A sorting domain-containing protein [Ignavibacteria bacterium]
MKTYLAAILIIFCFAFPNSSKGVSEQNKNPTYVSSFNSNSELYYFIHSTVRNNVTLKWMKHLDFNTAGFDIERAIINSEDIYVRVGYVIPDSPNQTLFSFAERLATGAYNYRLKQTDEEGNIKYYYLNRVVIVGVPFNFEVSQNYPNPFNPLTKIDFQLPDVFSILIKLYDISGKEVQTILDETRTAGKYTIVFDASSIPSGVYYYTLTASTSEVYFTETKRMMVIK